MKNTNTAAVRDAVHSYRYIDGRRVGLAGGSPSLAPGQPGEPDHEQWMQGWRSGSNEYAAEHARRLELVNPCRYDNTRSAPCNCGGRGLCLDVA